MPAELVSAVENRSLQPNTMPVWEKVIEFVTPSGTHAANIASIPINGILQKIIVECPATQATGKTFTFTIDDNGNNEIFALGATAEGDTYRYNVSESLCGEIDLTIDFDASVGTSDHTLTVTLRGV